MENISGQHSPEKHYAAPVHNRLVNNGGKQRHQARKNIRHFDRNRSVTGKRFEKNELNF